MSLLGRKIGDASYSQPYIAPHPDHPAHPETLWRRLCRAHGTALLIRGVGGSGKTRLLLEVAGLARNSDWHVIHILQRPSVSVSELLAAVFASEQPVLLVMDYPNELDGIELDELGELFLSETAEADATVAMLAAARPGWIATRPPLGPFEVVNLDQSLKYQGDVSRAIAVDVAPNARRRLKDAEFRRLVGDRPMIATLIARELESYAAEPHFNRDEVRGIHSGDLTAWLQRRLNEDGYSYKRPQKIAQMQMLQLGYCVATTIALATPNDWDAIRGPVTQVAAAGGSREPEGFAARTLKQLLEVGWLVETGGHITAVHDTVVDHLIGGVVDSDSHNGSTTYARSVIGPCTTHGPALQSVIANLHRYSTDPPEEDDALKSERARFMVQWVGQITPQICETILESPDGAMAASLFARLTAAPWEAGTRGLYRECRALWLVRHGKTLGALPVLLQEMQYRDPTRMHWATESVITWLETNGTEAEASVLLDRLLRNLKNLRMRWVQGAARTWLTTNSTNLDAGPLLVRILGRDHLARADWVRAAAESWLSVNGGSPEAGPLLVRLLRHSDLTRTEWVRLSAKAWLVRNSPKPQAASLLTSLIGRAEFASCDWVHAAVKVWFSHNVTSPRAETVLRFVIGRAEFAGADWVHAAVKTWLVHNGTSARANGVFLSLLAKRDFAHEDWVRDGVMAWLSHHGKSSRAGRVRTRLAETKPK